MVQRIYAFLCVAAFALGASVPSAAAEAKKTVAVPSAVQPEKKPQKTAEERYLDGLNCLGAADTGCAGAVLAGLSPASAYAKLLKAQIAAGSADYDTALRLLIPLQAETGLLPQAYASLHATLALAYESQDNGLYALEQRVKAEPYLANVAQVAENQARIWKLLAVQAKEALIEMRGESSNPIVQGWIDLALAVGYSERKERGIDQWRQAYPDHPIGNQLLASIAKTHAAAVPVTDAAPFNQKIALLLPLQSPAYASAAHMVQAGFMAAHKASADQAQITVYDSGGTEGVVQAYERAVAEGAQYVVGPLVRDEVNALVSQPLPTPVLALNQPEGGAVAKEHLQLFGLPVEAEATQVAETARAHGMQSALVIAADTPLGQRMAKAFVDAWRSQDGSIAAQLVIPAVTKLAELKAEAATHPADMIFLAADAGLARMARPYLDLAIPTYGISHIYDGSPKSVQNDDLVAVHFVDMPWIVDPGNPSLTVYRFAGNSGDAEMQRLYALGLDAYRLLPLLASGAANDKVLLDGATGRVGMGADGKLTREMSIAQFRRDGVALEDAP